MPASRRPRSSGRGRGSSDTPALPVDRRRWLRAGAIVLGAIVLLWITMANTVAGGALHRNHASRLVGFSPFDARLQSASARATFEAGRNKAGMLQAAAPAEQALLRDPTNVEALWVLGYVRGFQNRPEQSRALFQYADQLSRRDFPTRLWLIEERVQANDVNGALRNFDIALRTSQQAPTVLLPVLVSAAQDNNIAPRLLALLRTNPAWRQAFFEQLAQSSRSHSRAVYLMQGQLNASNIGDRFIARAAITRFLRENDPAQAYALYDVIAGVTPAQRQAPVRDSGFDRDGELPPFDWMLTAEENLAGLRQSRPDQNNNAALIVYSQGGRTGDVARQLLRLGPGSYRFGARVGNVPRGDEGQPSARLECVTGGARLFSSQFRQIGQGQTFSVPANCPFQWLIIAGGGVEGDQALPWIDDIAIARLQ